MQGKLLEIISEDIDVTGRIFCIRQILEKIGIQ